MRPSGVKDYYERLGVSRDISTNELKKTYHSLAMQWHPDKNSPERKEECELEFIAISEAYQSISGNEKSGSNQTEEKQDYEFYNNLYQDFLRAIEKVSPELAAVTRLFGGISMPPGFEAIFRDFYGRK
jgi:DnaJ-class molecular chaperone